ncbi:putative ribosomal protein L30 [Ophiocordyceps camponoti-floridani]|uniref:Large ribosomal subunit protein uL30m n=1 Tax=Ophiocordyceps camponoti-floridani TaxID=2030778 RepID=A0A8H4Q3Y3_9HYPO|nr:putative ribosomal protein L30 [Ophiocordyceps camponoti-floridani]
MPTNNSKPQESRKGTTMTFFQITQHRSAIGLPQRTRGALKSLGLRRRMQTVFQPVTPNVAGMILRVKELVRVKERVLAGEGGS